MRPFFTLALAILTATAAIPVNAGSGFSDPRKTQMVFLLSDSQDLDIGGQSETGDQRVSVTSNAIVRQIPGQLCGREFPASSIAMQVIVVTHGNKSAYVAAFTCDGSPIVPGWRGTPGGPNFIIEVPSQNPGNQPLYYVNHTVIRYQP